MKINKTRSWLYRIARILVDVNVIKKRRITRRIARRAAGKVTGQMLGKLFK